MENDGRKAWTVGVSDTKKIFAVVVMVLSKNTKRKQAGPTGKQMTRFLRQCRKVGLRLNP